MSIDFEIAGENWKVAGKLLSAACRAPSTAWGLGAAQGLQKLWDKWCKILHSRPLLALNFIIETSFFLYYFSHIFFYIFLHFSNYLHHSILCFLKKPSSEPCLHLSEFAKLHMGLVVLVKKMSVLINFLLQNTNLVSVLIKICPNFAGHVWQDWHISRTLWWLPNCLFCTSRLLIWR
jgi:hypothetical protein